MAYGKDEGKDDGKAGGLLMYLETRSLLLNINIFDSIPPGDFSFKLCKINIFQRSLLAKHSTSILV